MPKKRTYNFKQLQGSSSSTSKQATSQKDGDGASSSVNEKLSDLRKLEAKDAAAAKRQLAEQVNQRSVTNTLPPEVRGVLGISESAPPRPKAALRMRDRMRTPGPAPPKSWSAGSVAWTPALALRGSQRGSRKTTNVHDRNRPKQLLRFGRLTGLESEDVEKKPSSLTHLALKSIAESWDFFDAEDYPALAEIPIRLRLRLISYIDFCGPPVDSLALEALLQGSEGITQLDLAGLVGHGNLSIKKIARMLEKGQESHLDQESVVESWDADVSLETALRPSLQAGRFSHLTNLCLSHPAPKASWKDLLTLSKLTPQVTHLSLAYWPRPTLTPNLATATVSSQHSPDVAAGGSHYYSALDQDMSEPASLLRQLSSNLLYLQWLDLEGCQEWIPALAKLAADNVETNPAQQRTSEPEDWTSRAYTASSVFTSNWKNLNYLRCAQGWLPSLTGIQALQDRRDASAVDRVLWDGILKHLQDNSKPFSPFISSQDIIDVEKKKARLWLEHECRITYVCLRINSTRRSQGCKATTMDYGWVQRHVGPT